MTDLFSRRKRSAIMARIGGKDTAPEIKIRRLLHALGYRFRLHRKDLPGTPDIVLPRHCKVIFVHGCFWHGHPRCRRATLPTTNINFWQMKIGNNKKRDNRAQRQLRAMGWKLLVVWQCHMKNMQMLADKLTTFLEATE